IANIRRDATHKATTMLTKTYRRIGIEDLNVRGMARNRHLARSIMDGGFFEFRRQLDYKARFYGATIVVADRWYPSSKTCSCCGSAKTENWRCRSGCFSATNVGMRPGAISTLPGTSKTWPQALRSQPVERNALARFASPA
ncbi:MAG: transposase, partial [Methylacidiphilaceae bacterium]|nr:transposase [Candidatus Methylacidiphilaceae bacterium]